MLCYTGTNKHIFIHFFLIQFLFSNFHLIFLFFLFLILILFLQKCSPHPSDRLHSVTQIKATIFVQHVASKILSLVVLVRQHICYIVSAVHSRCLFNALSGAAGVARLICYFWLFVYLRIFSTIIHSP